MNKTQSKVRIGWVWWLIFPPYAFYCLMRSSLKLYIKIPAVLFVLLIGWLAYDMTVSPHRVEEARAKEEVTAYLKTLKKSDTISSTATLDKIERIGTGTSLFNNKVQPLVYYKVIVDKQSYQIGLASDKDEQLHIKHVEQTYPIRMGIDGYKKRVQPEIAVWLKENESKVGKPMELVSESENNLTQTVKTKKGSYTFKIGSQSLYEVKAENGKYLLKKENVLKLPDIVSDYLKENKKKAGTLVRTLGYEIHDSGEWYYFRTDKGDFRAELNYNGQVLLKKKR